MQLQIVNDSFEESRVRVVLQETEHLLDEEKREIRIDQVGLVERTKPDCNKEWKVAN